MANMYENVVWHNTTITKEDEPTFKAKTLCYGLQT